MVRLTRFLSLFRSCDCNYQFAITVFGAADVCMANVLLLVEWIESWLAIRVHQFTSKHVFCLILHD